MATNAERTAARLDMITVGHTTTVFGISVTRWDNNRWEIGTFRHSPALPLRDAAEMLTERWLDESALIVWRALRHGGAPFVARACLAERITVHATAAGKTIEIRPVDDAEEAEYRLVVEA
jgi:hypothetical protein